MMSFLMYHLIFATVVIHSINTKYVLIEIGHNKPKVSANQYHVDRYTSSKRMTFKNNTIYFNDLYHITMMIDN